jgi:hypothetical protein
MQRLQRVLDSGNAVVDLLESVALRHLLQVEMCPGVMADAVAFGSDPPHHRGVLGGWLAD